MRNEDKIHEILTAIQSNLTTVKQDVEDLRKLKTGFKKTLGVVDIVIKKIEELVRSIKDEETVAV